MYDITPIVELVLKLVAVAVEVVLLTYIRKKTTTEQQTQLEAWVSIAVSAAEQLYKEAGSGTAKKRYVLEWLAARGITVDTDKVDAMIESAVYKLKNSTIVLAEEDET